MDCKKTGEIILGLRKEKGLTQLELANMLCISDKTVSKWERGLGCPDVSLLRALSDVLKVDLQQLLLGELKPNKFSNGQMKNIDFYVCESCRNILFGLNDVELHCCGRRIEPLTIKACDDEHKINISEIEDEYFIEMTHPMNKSHYINFIAYVIDGGVNLIKLYPEQAINIRVPIYRKMDLYICCNEHGLYRYSDLK